MRSDSSATVTAAMNLGRWALDSDTKMSATPMGGLRVAAEASRIAVATALVIAG
jgi:hypothetical protein